jgi:hypothetical protein
MPYVDALTNWDIDFGKELWQALRQNRVFPAEGVFWLLDSENGWRLIVATPRVDDVGRRKAYEELGNVTRGQYLERTSQCLSSWLAPRLRSTKPCAQYSGKRPLSKEHDSEIRKSAEYISRTLICTRYGESRKYPYPIGYFIVIVSNCPPDTT